MPISLALGKYKVSMLVFGIALLLRIIYLLTLEIDTPIRADALTYFTIAFNLVNNHIYSMSSDQPLLISTFVTPGYPFFLTIPLGLTSSIDDFYHLTLVMQALLGSISCVLIYQIARTTISETSSVCVASLCAFSPHMIIAGGYLLTETLFIFTLLLSIQIFLVAVRKNNFTIFILSGILFGLASLVRPGLILFPIALSLYVFLFLASCQGYKLRLIQFTAILFGFIIMYGPWAAWSGIQEEAVNTNPIAAQISLGGYPDLVYKSEELKGYPYREDPEYGSMSKDPYVAASIIIERAKKETAKYLIWYLIKKPIMYHQASIIVGQGGAFIYPVQRSIYDVSVLMKTTYDIFINVHFVFVILAVISGVWVIYRAILKRDRDIPISVQVAALLIFYFTFLHTILAPLPRYSLTLYPFIFFIAVYGLEFFLKKIRRLG